MKPEKLATRPTDDLAQILDTMAKSPFFYRLDPDDAERIASHAEECHLDANVDLFAEGAIADRAYLIIEGKVLLYTGDFEKGAEIVREVGRGAMIGTSAFTKKREWDSARTRTAVKAFVWRKGSIQALYQEDSVAAFQLPVRGSLYENKVSVINSLKKTSIFHHTSPVLLRWLLDSATLMPVSRGELVFREGDAADALFLVLRGQVRIYRMGEKEETLCTLYGGDCFGEIALLENCPRTASAVVEKDSQLLVLTRSAFNHLCEVSHVFRREILAIAKERNISIQHHERKAETLFVHDVIGIGSLFLSRSLASSLKRQFKCNSLIVRISPEGVCSTPQAEVQKINEGVDMIELSTRESLRRLEPFLHSPTYDYVIVCCTKEDPAALAYFAPLNPTTICFTNEPSYFFPFTHILSGFVQYAIVQDGDGVTLEPNQPVRRGIFKISTKSLRNPENKQFEMGMDRLTRAVARKVVGVALGGGGAWGFGHLALLRCLNELDIPVDIVSGASFGSVVGAFYSSMGLKGLDFLEESVWRLSGAVAISPLTAKFIERFMESHLAHTHIEHLPILFRPVAVEILSGREKTFRRGSIASAVRASGSFPGIFSPMWINGVRYVDGGVLNNVPVSPLVEEGADFIISSNVIPAPRSLQEYQPSHMVNDRIRALNPLTRLGDTIRSFYILLKALGDYNGGLGNFAFEPNLIRFFPGDFRKASKIIEEANECLNPLRKDLLETYRAFRFGSTRRG